MRARMEGAREGGGMRSWGRCRAGTAERAPQGVCTPTLLT
jgi:hypothetical protein